MFEKLIWWLVCLGVAWLIEESGYAPSKRKAFYYAYLVVAASWIGVLFIYGLITKDAIAITIALTGLCYYLIIMGTSWFLSWCFDADDCIVLIIVSFASIFIP